MYSNSYRTLCCYCSTSDYSNVADLFVYAVCNNAVN